MREFLQSLVKLQKPEANLREAILTSIKNLCEKEKLNFSEYPNGCKSQNKESAVIVIQFGGRYDFYQTMETLNKEQATYRVIITSSNVKTMRINEIKWLLINKYKTNEKWLIVDIEHKERPKTVNFMLYSKNNEEIKEKEIKDKRIKKKRILGKKGKHKEQD